MGGLTVWCFAILLRRLDFSFAVAHCNFKLRTAESDGDAIFVSNWAKKHQIPHYEKEFETSQYAQEHTISKQMAARELRYDWFRHLLKKHAYTHLLTAHHLNDQLETYLINTTRGTGIKGLLGIPGNDPPLIRPLLPFSKAQIVAYAKEMSLNWREDSSNAGTDYLRNHIRHKVIPNMMSAQPDVLKNFANTLQILKEESHFIDLQTKNLKKELFKKKHTHVEIAVKKLWELNPLKFLLHRLFSPYGFDAEEVEKLLKVGSGKYIEGKTHRLIKDRTKLILTKFKTIQKSEYHINLDTPSDELPIFLYWKKEVQKEFKKRTAQEALLDKQLINSTLILRKAKRGDFFYPTGMKGKKLISKFFKDEKYSLLEKEKQWLLCSNNDVIWIVGKRCDRRFCASRHTKEPILFTTKMESHTK